MIKQCKGMGEWMAFLAYLRIYLSCHKECFKSITVKKGESPDFLLVLDSKTIGVEVTTAVSQQRRYEQVVYKEESYGHPYSPLPQSDEELTRQDIQQNIECQQDGELSGGATVEEDDLENYVNIVFGAICKKQKKLQKYSHRDENYLLLLNDISFSFLDAYPINGCNDTTTDKNVDTCLDKELQERYWIKDDGQKLYDSIFVFTPENNGVPKCKERLVEYKPQGFRIAIDGWTNWISQKNGYKL